MLSAVIIQTIREMEANNQLPREEQETTTETELERYILEKESWE